MPPLIFFSSVWLQQLMKKSLRPCLHLKCFDIYHGECFVHYPSNVYTTWLNLLNVDIWASYCSCIELYWLEKYLGLKISILFILLLIYFLTFIVCCDSFLLYLGGWASTSRSPFVLLCCGKLHFLTCVPCWEGHFF